MTPPETADSYAGLVICLTDPMTELRREPDQVRWCYRCRKRLMHEYVLMGYTEQPPTTDDPAAWEAWEGSQACWYEPSWERQCSNCKGDYTRMWGL